MDQKNSQEARGCFAWLFRAKKSVNERLARIRNSMRRKLAQENRLVKPLTPDDLENETGSPDLIITRILVTPRQTTSTGGTPSAVATDKVKSPLPGVCNIEQPSQLVLEKNGYIGCTSDGNPDPLQVINFVKNIIRCAEEEVSGIQNIKLGSPIVREDTTSLASSVMSS